MAKQIDTTKSMVDIAELIIRQEGKKNIYDLLEQVTTVKGVSMNDTEAVTQLYLDMTMSAKFVFCGNDTWDLKENNLDLWDKDGSFFNQNDDVEDDEEEDDITIEDYYIPEEVELIIEDDEDDEERDSKIKAKDDDDEPVDGEAAVEADDNSDFDDEDYNEIMDDYEDMYDK
ncbi:MAG TPA: DNA-directed RNA polymerase subunit delta [Acholeplasma sp.]|nr:DNA-directed RNA polymerase subunit delta [Acholeplasma sp.]